MKRSIDQVGSSSSGPPPLMNRQNSVASEMSVGGMEDIVENSATYFLKSQNRALSQELFRNKRTIAEARKELDLMRRKTREMESLVSLVQRAWSQLDIDTSMLLDSLGDPESAAPADGNTELLERLIHAGTKHNLTAPTNIEDIPNLDVDEWSSSEEIDDAKKEAMAQLTDVEVLDNEFGGPVEENLAAHASFTLSLLERLCNAINESADISITQEALATMADHRAHQAESLMLNDRIVKLSLEVIELKAELVTMENAKLRTERKLDRVLSKAVDEEKKKQNAAAAAAVANASNASTVATEGVRGEGSAEDATAGLTTAQVGGAPVAPLVAIDPSIEKELKRQIAVLERQLTESETAKSHGEMQLTERVARPLAQTEGQIADMRKSMEELRQQCKTRVNQLLQENMAYQEKLKSFEIAVAHLEAETTSRIAEIITQANVEITAARVEKEAAQTQYANAQADIVMASQLKAQLSELQVADALAQSEVRKLQNELSLANKTLDIVNSSLKNSREREEKLTSQVQSKIVAAVKENDDEGGVDTGDVITALAANEEVARQAQARAVDLQSELDASKNSTNDLILEIEAVCAEEVKSREQNMRLMKQISECQSMQRVALEENLKLQNQIEDLKSSKKDMEKRTEVTKNLVKQQETQIQQLRSAEQNLRIELQNMKKSLLEASSKLQNENQKVQEGKQNLADAEGRIEAAQKRNMELHSRCDELTSQCETARKEKHAAQREISKLKNSKKGANGSGAGANASSAAASSSEPADTDMLDMTLGMLRCSVCRDRFKSAVITRCFHLFCKECLDENLRNRHRKCPACGEKFGQDDVRNIYFTH